MIKSFSVSLVLFFLFTLSLSAQRQLPAIFENAEGLIARYELNEKQQVALERILDQREQNLAAIEDLKASNELSYWQKRKNIYLGEQASIKMILDTPQQIAAFDQRRLEVRREESILIKELIAEGYNKQEARLLLLQRKY